MAQLIYQILGHREQKDHLLNMIRGDHMPSALIFQGPQGVGKKAMVHALLQVMNCVEDELACGKCSNCTRSLEEKNELIFELKPEGKKTISVDQVRDLHQYLSLKSLSKARFVLIDPADALSTQAANSLLKVLEEAPPNTHFFLLTDRVFSLLPTIRSRAVIVSFSKLSNQELQEMNRFDDVALSWADGRVGLAEQMQEEGSVERLNESLKFLYSLTCEGPQDWKKKAPWFFGGEEDRQFGFNIWDQALNKRLHSQGENLDWLPEKSGDISRLYFLIEDLKKDIKGNVDKQLALENLYYKFHGQRA